MSCEVVNLKNESTPVSVDKKNSAYILLYDPHHLRKLFNILDLMNLMTKISNSFMYMKLQFSLKNIRLELLQFNLIVIII